MAHQLSIKEIPNHEWEPASKDISTETTADLYSLVSSTLQSSQKAVLENEREDKILQNFSNALRHAIVTHQSEIKATAFRTQEAFYTKLIQFWKILYPDQEECPASIEDMFDALAEGLKELKKDSSLEKNVLVLPINILEISA